MSYLRDSCWFDLKEGSCLNLSKTDLLISDFDVEQTAQAFLEQRDSIKPHRKSEK